MNEKDQTLTKVFDSISCHALRRLCLITARFNSLLIWWHPPALWLMVLHMWGTASSAVHELLHQRKLAVAGHKNSGAALVLPCSKLRKPVVQGTMNAKHYMNLTKDVKQARRDKLKVTNTMSKQEISTPESMVESRDCMERCKLLHKQKKQQMLMDTTRGGTLRILPVTALRSNITSDSYWTRHPGFLTN